MFIVRVADNFHYLDEEAEYVHAAHSTWEAAVAAARRIVEASLAEHYRPGMSVADLYGWYTSFGDAPYIVPQPDGEWFSAWAYARERCDALCGGSVQTPNR